ncbi:MAG TPA: cache domain-containing protein [Syntrophorhabdales bacterium]|nr:cache domain-containing protein [Syntrophorhabdales bacterium]
MVARRFPGVAIVVICTLLLLCCSCHENIQNWDKTRPYLYEDTKRLVYLVEDAAGLMEKQGTAAFTEFGTKGSRWLEGTYLFVYDLNGTCVFHPITPQLIGKNLMDFHDMNGKPVIRYLTDIGRRQERDASGWVFYLWEEGTQFLPRWKSSYTRKVKTPDGKTYVIGSGSYNLKIEKICVQDIVKEAVELMAAKGKTAAFEELRKPGSPFHFLDNYVFVMSIDGHSVVDPSYPTMAGRDLTNFRDAIGRYVVKEMIAKLQTSDEGWVLYLWPKPGAALPSRKLVYIRKITVEGETLIVGSDFFLATPIWVK